MPDLLTLFLLFHVAILNKSICSFRLIAIKKKKKKLLKMNLRSHSWYFCSDLRSENGTLRYIHLQRLSFPCTSSWADCGVQSGWRGHVVVPKISTHSNPDERRPDATDAGIQGNATCGIPPYD